MGESNVRDILEQIGRLPEPDRLVLEQRLAELEEAEWLREAVQARRAGIDQAAIDHAVEQARYGRRGATGR